jgi:hypothetical protein
MLSDDEIEKRMEKLGYPEELRPLVKDYIKNNYTALTQDQS